MVDFIVPPGQHAFSIRHDGRHRTGTWCVPHEWTPPHRLVLAFHGAGSCAADMMPFSGLQAWADHAGAVVAFLDGTGRRAGAYTWNGGPECGYAGRHRVDDLGFVERLMDETEAQLAASVTWLAVGMSNGGLFALRLAEQLSPRFPAVAAVAASTASGPLPPPPPCPVSVLFLHGTEDAFVPFRGHRPEQSHPHAVSLDPGCHPAMGKPGTSVILTRSKSRSPGRSTMVPMWNA